MTDRENYPTYDTESNGITCEPEIPLINLKIQILVKICNTRRVRMLRQGRRREVL